MTKRWTCLLLLCGSLAAIPVSAENPSSLTGAWVVKIERAGGPALYTTWMFDRAGVFHSSSASPTGFTDAAGAWERSSAPRTFDFTALQQVFEPLAGGLCGGAPGWFKINTTVTLDADRQGLSGTNSSEGFFCQLLEDCDGTQICEDNPFPLPVPPALISGRRLVVETP